MTDFTASDWEDAFYANWRLYLAGLQRQSAANQQLLSANPPERHLVESPGGGGAASQNSCQILVQDLFQEARAFHGHVPVATGPSWLKEIEACKGKIPESEYAEAMAILGGPT